MIPLEDDSAIRHIRGATVVHQSPFHVLEVPSVADLLSEEECEKWVVPFYRVSFRSPDGGFLGSRRAIYNEIWRTYLEAKQLKPDLENNVSRFADKMRALKECRTKAEAGR